MKRRRIDGGRRKYDNEAHPENIACKIVLKALIEKQNLIAASDEKGEPRDEIAINELLENMLSEIRSLFVTQGAKKK